MQEDVQEQLLQFVKSAAEWGSLLPPASARPIEIVVRRITHARFGACMCRVAARGGRNAADSVDTLHV